MRVISRVPANKALHYPACPRSALLLIHGCGCLILQSNEHASLGQCDVLIRFGSFFIEALPCPISNLHHTQMTMLTRGV